ncbi:MAG: MGMT family protein [Clostridia bacterium]|nr:MGMT family protein [Clostridia bacterium]
MNFFEKVYEAVKQIPKGKVATYGQIALAAGSPRAARQVGYALHVNPQPFVIPCHRVVNRFGGLAPAFAFGGREVQVQLLRAEGVEVNGDGFVDLQTYLYQGDFSIPD